LPLVGVIEAVKPWLPGQMYRIDSAEIRQFVPVQ
jgi:hypothetical protein